MSTRFLANIKINNNNQKRKSLNYIAFIKFMAMIKIIKWHIYSWKKRKFDYGARMCEFLFIASGFLVGYNHYNRNMPSDYETSIKYTYKHLRTFYPLECFNIIYGFYRKHHKHFNLTDFEILLSNFFLIKPWSRHTGLVQYFTGISWFLSDLLFCYFLVPFLLKGINQIKKSLILFLIVSCIRISIEEIVHNGGINLFDADFHRGPFIRLLEFYLGMLLIPTFYLFKNNFDIFTKSFSLKIFFTFIQISFPSISYFIMLKYNDKLYRCYFVLIFCVFIFIISNDYGYLSNIFAHKLFVKIMSCQMEIYLIQNTMNNIIDDFQKTMQFSVQLNSELKFLSKLIIIFIAGYLYKILLKEKLANFMDKLILKFKKLFL